PDCDPRQCDPDRDPYSSDLLCGQRGGAGLSSHGSRHRGLRHRPGPDIRRRCGPVALLLSRKAGQAMIARRDLLIGVACCLRSGAAYALKPRRQTTLMGGDKKLNDILPRTLENWTSRDVSDLVAPETPDSLAARLYGETVGRIYRQQSTGDEVIMLMAHGDVENNELQLHRPEVCYPAFGFAITESAPLTLALSSSVTVPCRSLVAKSSDRQETILYWTRLGETFPTTVAEQR